MTDSVETRRAAQAAYHAAVAAQDKLQSEFLQRRASHPSWLSRVFARLTGSKRVRG